MESFWKSHECSQPSWNPVQISLCLMCWKTGKCQSSWILRIYSTTHRQVQYHAIWGFWRNQRSRIQTWRNIFQGMCIFLKNVKNSCLQNFQISLIALVKPKSSKILWIICKNFQISRTVYSKIKVWKIWTIFKRECALLTLLKITNVVVVGIYPDWEY